MVFGGNTDVHMLYFRIRRSCYGPSDNLVTSGLFFSLFFALLLFPNRAEKMSVETQVPVHVFVGRGFLEWEFCVKTRLRNLGCISTMAITEEDSLKPSDGVKNKAKAMDLIIISLAEHCLEAHLNSTIRAALPTSDVFVEDIESVILEETRTVEQKAKKVVAESKIAEAKPSSGQMRAAMVIATDPPVKGPMCYRCQGSSHLSKHCVKYGEDRPKCGKCGKYGHEKAKYTKRAESFLSLYSLYYIIAMLFLRCIYCLVPVIFVTNCIYSKLSAFFAYFNRNFDLLCSILSSVRPLYCII
ncbi:uncharacterized protein LOC135847068 [Planococcus citri]|uniref:uncharacterized protein LOC135847068 n=1 Tax=Planococcus citri TaxID=170843 RepID=UPI0031F78A76